MASNFPIFVAQWTGTFPEVRHYVVDTTNGANIIPGSLVLTASDGEVELCGADPAAVLGVALGSFQGSAGYGMPNSPSQVQNRANTVPVAIANADTVFGVASATTPATTHLNEEYGVVNSSGNWLLDTTETSAKVFHIVGIDIDRGTFLCRVLASVAEANA